MGAFRRHDSGPTGAAHDHIRLVVPANVSGGPLCLCIARGRQDGRAQSGGSARLDEVAPAGGRLIPNLGDLCFAFFDHDKFLLGKPSSGPRMTTTLAANSRLSRGYSAPARRGSIAACMAAYSRSDSSSRPTNEPLFAR